MPVSRGRRRRRRGRRPELVLPLQLHRPRDRYTTVPGWWTGDDQTGPRVAADAFRLAVATARYRDRHGVCRLAPERLAEVIGERPDRVPTLLEQLRHAGMVATVSPPGRPMLIVPLMAPAAAVRPGPGCGHHAQVPDGLLHSRAHPADAVLIYAIADLLAQHPEPPGLPVTACR